MRSATKKTILAAIVAIFIAATLAEDSYEESWRKVKASLGLEREVER